MKAAKQYLVPGYAAAEDAWASAPKAWLDCWYPLEGNRYYPATYGQLCRSPAGMHVRMVCAERWPRAEMREPNGPVCTDSCLEFFLAPLPEEDAFLNFELNARGTMLLGINERGRFRRLDPALQGGCYPWASVDEAAGTWEVSFRVPDDLIRELFSGCEPEKATWMRGNFYKCGDKTQAPHYGSWNPITRDPIDFHCPECFGNIYFERTENK